MDFDSVGEQRRRLDLSGAGGFEMAEKGQYHGDGDEISLNLPRKNADTIYTYRLAGALQTHNMVFAGMQDSTDPYLVSSTREAIICILDSRVKRELLDAFERALEAVDGLTGDRAGDKGRYIVRVCQLAVSEVYDYMDEFIGVQKTTTIARVYTPPSIKQDGDSEPYDESEEAVDATGE